VCFKLVQLQVSEGAAEDAEAVHSKLISLQMKQQMNAAWADTLTTTYLMTTHNHSGTSTGCNKPSRSRQQKGQQKPELA